MTLIEQIAAHMSDYTKTERLIAERILENVLEFTVYSISDISEELGISKTSLIRFAKKMGFDGYIGFRKKLQEEEVMKHSSSERFQKLIKNNFMSSVDKIKHKEMDSIEACFDNLNVTYLETFIDKIIEGKRVYAGGLAVDAFLAEILCYRMKEYGYAFEALDRGKSSFEYQLLHAQEGDILILFDFPIYSSPLLETIRYAKMKGMFLVVITDYATCPLTKHSDLVFYCDSQIDLFNNSLVAPIFFINLLVSVILYKNDEKMVEYLKKKEELLQLMNGETV